MAITLRTTAYGPPAHTALAEAIDRHKDGDPLRPISVIVPSNHVGIAARRALGRRGGIAAVTFLTPYRLAELLGAAAVASTGRRPVSTPVLAGAVRAVLHDDPGHFMGVHTHPATERALVRAHRALSEVGPGGLRDIAATSTRAADVVRIHRSVGELLRPRFSNEQDLVAAAIEAIEATTPVIRDLGPSVVFLPQRLSTSQARLLNALAAARPVDIVAGVTGDEQADAAVRDGVLRLGASWPDDPTLVASGPTPAVADAVLSVSDADDEVRHAVRHIVEAAREGVAFGRCAIIYGSHDPYARLVGDALAAAGISWFGTSICTAESSLLGRSLLALLALPDHDYSRRDVAAWLAAAPIRGLDNRPAPVAAWERASRAAGVVAGLDQWADRLGRLGDDLRLDADRFARDEEEGWRADRLRREADEAETLAMFVAALASDLNPGGRASTWTALARWCRHLVSSYLGGDALRSDWPREERAAAGRVDVAIDRLGDLDGVDPAPSVPAFRRALELQLADDLGRHGSFGNGVMVGNAALAIGLELDRVVVLGMAEGSFPARRRDDPLLPDRVRALIGTDLASRSEVVSDDHRALLAVVEAAGHALFTFPRGDLRRSSERAPSRWLLDSVELRHQIRPAADDLDRLTGAWFREVPSFVAGLRASSFPANEQEYDVRALLDTADRFSTDAVHDLDLVRQRPALRRGLRLIRERASSRFTRFDGNLASDGDLRGARLPSLTEPDQITSATRLEAWAKCPHAYFVHHVLGVHPVEDPQEQYRITPLALGTMVHEVLDRWIAEALRTHHVPAAGAPWSDDQRHRLLELGADVADGLQARGLSGRAVYWPRDRRVMLTDLSSFVDFDTQQRAARAASPIATELPFGMPHSPTSPITISLPSGRRLRLRGSVDRIDETAAGELIVVDYKTGKPDGYRGLSPENPTPGGAHLQLALYSAAVRQVLDRPDAPTRGEYWFVTRRGRFQTAGYRITTDVESRAFATVEGIVDGIGAGLFPQHPGAPGWRMFVECPCCEPDGLGLAHQFADWTRIQDDPDLTPYLRLVRTDADHDDSEPTTDADAGS